MREVIHATIESMAFGGYGVSRLHGKIVFIPYAVTGDDVEAEIVQKRRDYAVARPITIVTPSPWRIAPRCPYFGRCGGCQWQHIDYGMQGELKRKILEETLIRLGHVTEIPPIDVIPSPQPHGYRIRIHLKTKGEKIGYYEARSRRIVDIDHCPIAHPLINHILPSLRHSPPLLRHSTEVEIRVSPQEGQGSLVLRARVLDKKRRRSMENFRKDNPILQGIAVSTEDGMELLGTPHLTFSIPIPSPTDQNTLSLRTSPGSFFQVNLVQNQSLIHTVLEFAGPERQHRLLDLYAGVGNLTLPLALSSDEALGIEESRSAVEDACFNAKRNGIDNCQFILGRVEEHLPTLRNGKTDLIVLDPPRTGCKAVIQKIIALNPKKIIYVSCNPATLARDLCALATGGYSLRAVRLLDFFPQSYHMEVVALLR